MLCMVVGVDGAEENEVEVVVHYLSERLVAETDGQILNVGDQVAIQREDKAWRVASVFSSKTRVLH